MGNLTDSKIFEKQKKELESGEYENKLEFLIHENEHFEKHDWEDFENTWAIQNGY